MNICIRTHTSTTAIPKQSSFAARLNWTVFEIGIWGSCSCILNWASHKNGLLCKEQSFTE